MPANSTALTAPVVKDVRALGAALTPVCLWGSAFVAIRAAGEHLSPGSISLGRLLVSLVILTPIAAVRRQKLPSRRDLMLAAAYGVLWMGVYSFTLNSAERHIDAGTAAMLINIGPILIAALAGSFLHEGFPRRLWFGSILAFSGCVLVGLAHSGPRQTATLGVALCLLAAGAYASAAVVQKSILGRVSVFQVTYIGFVAATIACLPFAPMLVRDLSQAPTAAIVWTVYLGIGPTVVGFLAWTYALGGMPAGQMAAFVYLIPVVATLLGWVILDETPAGLAFLGGALTLIGVYVARRQPKSRLSQSLTVIHKL